MSIVYSAERKIAILDDQMLATGDRIKGAELVGLTRCNARLKRKSEVIKSNVGTELTAIKKKAVKSDLLKTSSCNYSADGIVKCLCFATEQGSRRTESTKF